MIMEERLIEKTDQSIKDLLDKGLTTTNLDILYKLSKIRHMAKEDESMNYGNYNGRGPSRGAYGNYGEYGNYNEYGRRGRDMKYRGDENLDRLGEEYGRYQEYRGRYGASEDTDKAHHYMVKALEDFIKYLMEDAEIPQQKQEIKETLQRSMM